MDECRMHALLRAKKAYVMVDTTGRFQHLAQVRRELVGVFLENASLDELTNPILVPSIQMRN